MTSQDTRSDPLTGESHAEIFVRTPGGRLLAMLDYTGGSLSDGGADYFMLDDMKTVEALVPAAEPGTGQAGGDANPDAVRYAYEPYGQTIRTWVDPDPGTAADAYSEDAASEPTEDYNPFGYVAGYTDKATGLVKFGTRYYAPQLATWTQRDSEEGAALNPLTQNAYLYAGQDPSGKTDESGRVWCGWLPIINYGVGAWKAGSAVGAALFQVYPVAAYQGFTAFGRFGRAVEQGDYLYEDQDCGFWQFVRGLAPDPVEGFFGVVGGLP